MVRAVLALLLVAACGATADAAAPGDVCLRAASVAAERHGMPADMLQAITLVETRRPGTGRPWPWTLNIEGEGKWFDSRADALAHARRVIEAGRISTDLGCFQINYRWHGAEFADLAEMIDPDTSADYAARFLRQLFAETGNWLEAAGHYHSRTPVHATRYKAHVAAALDAPLPAPAEPPRPTVTAVRALWPVSADEGARSAGSLWGNAPLPGRSASAETAPARQPAGGVALGVFTAPGRSLLTPGS